MKRNYKFLISYDGSRYKGWEHQPGAQTVQGKIETVLSKMVYGENYDGPVIEINGAGRTDGGVHARGMCANAFFETELSEEEIKDYMNHYLPDDIGIDEVRIASDRFHARYNATGKTYRYSCYYGEEKPVFERKFLTVLEEQPDVEKMREAAEHLTGTHDFLAFCGNASKMKKSTVRTVDSIKINENG
ncbi:MAG: tRNA pseudouridine(38-40) synthase TruA, partial [Lachnospiraceae bacterium]|nr:tRNA pseudouridine(38-40) synthase TruA [Lachnospiraceae bacterium]